MAAPLDRVPATTIRLPSELRPSGYQTVPAFPGVFFDSVVGFATPPGETDRLFVVEKNGRIVVLTNLASPTRTIFLDLSWQVDAADEAGLLGLAFHPRFRDNGQFFVFYTLQTSSLDQRGLRQFGLHDRLSRFRVSADRNRADETSEQVLISQFDRAYNHNGGDIHFGPDGYLYVSLGDEGGGNDSFENGQRIDLNFFSGILRIDVDKRPGSLPPNPHGAASANYAIPPDNPFIGVTSFNGTGVDPQRVRTEFWAVGLRNPWRFAFDPVTGDLLCGDVGQGSREEVNLIQRGGNYGWSLLEGSVSWAPYPPGFTDIKPIAEYQRPGASLELDRQGYCIIGGVVYRGSRLPELFGKYIFGDWGTRLYWSLQHDGRQATEFTPLFAGESMNCFGTDPRNGDVLIGGRNVLRLIANSATQELPGSLAETGVFADVTTLTPAPGVVPYDVNVPFWSDDGRKRRWFSVPDLSKTLTFRPEANWSFPAGSVWIKHFDLEMIRGVPDSARRIETRLLVKTSDGVYGVTYRWGNSVANASLVPPEGMDEEFWIQDNGNVRRQVWHYPGRSECLSCHTPAGGHVLGFTTAQLNRTHDYPGITENQLEAFSAAGYFNAGISNPENLLRLARADDSSATVEHRVRSYLAANCSQCHQPSGTALGHWDARIQGSTANAGLINGTLNDNGGNAEARVIRPGSLENSMLLTRINHRGAGQMPPLGSSVVDTENVNLVSYWITNVLADPPALPITLGVSGLGSIRGLTNGQRLEPGRSYSVTAVPADGQLFTHWTGTIHSTVNPLHFQMQPGMALTANFVTNSYPGFQGTYVGLVQTPATPLGSGWANGTVNSRGTYSIRLDFSGQRLALSGRLSENGLATNQIAHQHLGPLRVELKFDATTTTDLTGRIVGSGWTAGLVGIRPYPSDPVQFTWATQGESTAPLSSSDAYGTIRVNANGRAMIQGKLPTGRSFSQASALSSDGRLPIYLEVGGQKSALGWTRVGAGGRTLSGALTWKTTESGASPIAVDVSVIGSRITKSYSLPPGTHVNVICTEGGLSTIVSNSIVVDTAKLRWISSDAPRISLRIDWKTGLFTGLFTGPTDSRPQIFHGALLQEQGYGAGYFPGTNQNGRVTLTF